MAFIPYRSFALQVEAVPEEAFAQLGRMLDQKAPSCAYCGWVLTPGGARRFCANCGHPSPGIFRLEGVASPEGFRVKMVRREQGISGLFLRRYRSPVPIEGRFEESPLGTRISVRIREDSLEVGAACLLLLVFGTYVGIEAGPVGLLMLLPGLFLVYAVNKAFFMADADTAQEILTRLWSRTSRPARDGAQLGVGRS